MKWNIGSASSDRWFDLPTFKEIGFTEDDLFASALLIGVPVLCGGVILVFIWLKQRRRNRRTRF